MGVLGEGASAESGASSASSSSAAGSAQGGDTSSSSSAAASGGQPSWRDSLPDDMKSNALLQQFSDVPNLAKSYINAQELIGKKGVIPPGEKATDEQRAQFYKDLGLPDLDKYEIKAPEGMTLREDFVKGFKEIAHKQGIMPKQAEQLLGWSLGVEQQFMKGQKEAQDKATQEGLAALKQEWGQGYDKQIALGDMALRELGGEAFINHVVKTGLAKDSQFIKLMAKVGGIMGEDKLRGEDFRKFGSETPQDIQKKIDTMMGDPQNPYFDPSHPGHKNAVNQMGEWFKKLHG